MQYENRIVCFLDILGFKSHIDATVTAGQQDDEDRIDALVDALHCVRNASREADHFPSKTVTHFSDSLVVSFRIEEEAAVFFTLLEILWMQMQLALRGFLCRGALARGKLIHDTNHVFGPALVQAYTLESTQAQYPRVLVPEDVVMVGADAHAAHNSPIHELEHIGDLLSEDEDGRFYIDYVKSAQAELDDPEYGYPIYLDKLADAVLSGPDTAPVSVQQKLDWLRKKCIDHLDTCVAWSQAQGREDLLEAFGSTRARL